MELRVIYSSCISCKTPSWSLQGMSEVPLMSAPVLTRFGDDVVESECTLLLWSLLYSQMNVVC
jgi:hypothetical protein